MTNIVETDTAAVSRETRGLNRAGRRTAACAVVTLEILTAIAAFGGGAMMIADPAGAMGLSPEMLDRLPVDSWLLPGVALIASNGMLPTAVAVAELRGEPWPRRFGHIVVGAVLLAWPATETWLFGYPLEGEPRWLRPGVAATGLMIIGLGLLLRRGAKREGRGVSSTMRGRSDGGTSTAGTFSRTRTRTRNRALSIVTLASRVNALPRQMLIRSAGV